MDHNHYQAYLDGEAYVPYGDFYDVGLIELEVPYDGYWYVVVDSYLRKPKATIRGPVVN